MKCQVQPNYKCIGTISTGSICFVKPVGNCGNGILEPAKGEICDDGNIKVGDGCDDLCKVEFGWVCPDSKKCLSLQDPRLKEYCGNGVNEKNYG